ncbi:hypothetical protein ACQP1W_05170 [Spirillospora sp. CA-255316]
MKERQLSSTLHVKATESGALTLQVVLTGRLPQAAPIAAGLHDTRNVDHFRRAAGCLFDGRTTGYWAAQDRRRPTVRDDGGSLEVVLEFAVRTEVSAGGGTTVRAEPWRLEQETTRRWRVRAAFSRSPPAPRWGPLDVTGHGVMIDTSEGRSRSGSWEEVPERSVAAVLVPDGTVRPRSKTTPPPPSRQCRRNQYSYRTETRRMRTELVIDASGRHQPSFTAHLSARHPADTPLGEDLLRHHRTTAFRDAVSCLFDGILTADAAVPLTRPPVVTATGSMVEVAVTASTWLGRTYGPPSELLRIGPWYVDRADPRWKIGLRLHSVPSANPTWETLTIRHPGGWRDGTFGTPVSAGQTSATWSNIAVGLGDPLLWLRPDRQADAVGWFTSVRMTFDWISYLTCILAVCAFGLLLAVKLWRRDPAALPHGVGRLLWLPPVVIALSVAQTVYNDTPHTGFRYLGLPPLAVMAIGLQVTAAAAVTAWLWSRGRAHWAFVAAPVVLTALFLEAQHMPWWPSETTAQTILATEQRALWALLALAIACAGTTTRGQAVTAGLLFTAAIAAYRVALANTPGDIWFRTAPGKQPPTSALLAEEIGSTLLITLAIFGFLNGTRLLAAHLGFVPRWRPDLVTALVWGAALAISVLSTVRYVRAVGEQDTLVNWFSTDDVPHNLLIASYLDQYLWDSIEMITIWLLSSWPWLVVLLLVQRRADLGDRGSRMALAGLLASFVAFSWSEFYAGLYLPIPLAFGVIAILVFLGRTRVVTPDLAHGRRSLRVNAWLIIGSALLSTYVIYVRPALGEPVFLFRGPVELLVSAVSELMFFGVPLYVLGLLWTTPGPRTQPAKVLGLVLAGLVPVIVQHASRELLDQDSVIYSYLRWGMLAAVLSCAAFVLHLDRAAAAANMTRTGSLRQRFPALSAGGALAIVAALATIGTYITNDLPQIPLDQFFTKPLP